MDAQPVEPTPPIRRPVPIAQVAIVLMDNNQCAVNYDKAVPLKVILSMLNSAQIFFVNGMPDERPKILQANFMPSLPPVNGSGKR